MITKFYSLAYSLSFLLSFLLSVLFGSKVFAVEAKGPGHMLDVLYFAHSHEGVAACEERDAYKHGIQLCKQKWNLHRNSQVAVHLEQFKKESEARDLLSLARRCSYTATFVCKISYIAADIKLVTGDWKANDSWMDYHLTLNDSKTFTLEGFIRPDAVLHEKAEYHAGGYFEQLEEDINVWLFGNPLFSKTPKKAHFKHKGSFEFEGPDFRNRYKVLFKTDYVQGLAEEISYELLYTNEPNVYRMNAKVQYKNAGEYTLGRFGQNFVFTMH